MFIEKTSKVNNYNKKIGFNCYVFTSHTILQSENFTWSMFNVLKE